MQYHAIKVLLNRQHTSRSITTLEQKWDRYILYHFLLTMRLRNSEYFVWWGIINAAVGIGSHENNLAICFGLAVTVKTLFRNLDTCVPYHEIMKRSRDTLAASSLLNIGIWNNCQNAQQLKYQRGAKSSTRMAKDEKMLWTGHAPSVVPWKCGQHLEI
jgi:hypothetical protein